MSAGTIFTELDLDFSKFEKNQQKLLASAKEASTSVEKNWQNLGVKSDNIYNAMRASAENSLNMIKNHAGTSAAEITRAQEAMSAKISAINKQQFGEHTSFLESAKANWVAFSVAAVAAWALVNKAVTYMDMGAKAMQIESSFKIIAEESGVMADDLIANMKRATKGTIDDSDLQQKAVKLMLAGYDPSQIERFSNVAITASQYMGVSVGESFERISDALASRMPKAMVQAGAVTREQMAIVTSAIKAGADQSVLFELAIANLEVKQLKLQGTVDGATLALQRFHAQVHETQEIIGKEMIVGLQLLWAGFQNIGVMSLTASAGIYKVMQAEKSLAAMSTWGDRSKEYESEAAEYKVMAESDMGAAVKLRQQAIDNFKGNSQDTKRATQEQIAAAQAKVDSQVAVLKGMTEKTNGEKEAADKTEQLQKQISEATRKAQVEIDGYGQDAYEKEMARIESEKAKWEEQGAAKVSMAKWYTAETTIANQKMEDEAGKLAQADFDEWCKLQNEKQDKAKKDAADKVKAERDLYKDIRGYENEAYAGTIALIESQAKEYKKKGVSRVAIETWVTQETIKADIKRGESSNDFFDGWSSGLKQMQLDQTRWGQVGASACKGTMTTMSKSFDDILYNGLTGKFDSISDAWTSVWQGMLKATTGAIGKMAAEKVMLYLEANWTQAGTAVLGIVDKLLGLVGITSNLGSMVTGGDYGALSDATLASYAAEGYASGGRPPVDKPVWVGEEGRELAFFDSPAYIMPHGESMAYAARNGGYIPGRAEGGYTQTQDGSWVSSAPPTYTGLNTPYGNGFYFPDAVRVGNNSDPLSIPNDGNRYELHTEHWDPRINRRYITYDLYQNGNLLNNITEYDDDPNRGSQGGLGGLVGWVNQNVGPMVFPTLAAAIISQIVVGAGNAVYGAMGAGAVGGAASAGAAAGSAAATGITTGTTTAGMIAAGFSAEAIAGIVSEYGATEASLLNSVMVYASDTLGNITTGDVAKFAAKQLVKRALGTALSSGATGSGGGGGSLSLSLAGGSDNGIGATLSELFGTLGKSHVISARNGINYVPRDNTLVNTHEGEAVITKKENAARLKGMAGTDGATLPPVQVILNVDGRKLGSIMYHQSKAGVKIIHSRGITDI